jgi:hypothetical protein
LVQYTRKNLFFLTRHHLVKQRKDNKETDDEIEFCPVYIFPQKNKRKKKERKSIEFLMN